VDVLKFQIDELERGRECEVAVPGGWAISPATRGAIKAIPFAIWWLVIIESVALAAELAGWRDGA